MKPHCSAHRQRGQILPYVAVGVAVVVLGLGVAVKVQSARLEAVKQEYDGFKAQVKANGDAALKAKKEQEAKDKATKERIDNETKLLRASNAVLNKRLRDYVATSGRVSDLPATTGSPDLICFDRAA